MTKNTLERHGLVTFGAILMFLVGGFTLVFAASTFSNASFLSDFRLDIGTNRLWISGVIDLFIAAGCFWAGYSLLRGKKFGFYFALAFAVINALKWFFFMFWFPVMGVVSIVIDGLIIYSMVKSEKYFDDYYRLGLM